MGLRAVCQRFVEKSSQRTSNSDSKHKKEVLKTIRFSNYFMLAVFISLIRFSKIVSAVWNFVRSLKFYYKNNFCPSFKINCIGLLYFKLNSRKREILLNTATIRNSTEIDSNFTARETQDYAPLQRQTSHNQTSTTSKHAIEFTYSDFPCHFKVNRDKLALTYRRWMSKRKQKIDDCS